MKQIEKVQPNYFVRDKGRYLKAWFDDKEAAKKFIKKHDPKGRKGYELGKAKH